MPIDNKYWKIEYARLKGVAPSRITQLKPKLVMGEINGKECVIDCEENDKLFLRPSKLAKRNKPCE